MLLKNRLYYKSPEGIALIETHEHYIIYIYSSINDVDNRLERDKIIDLELEEFEDGSITF